MTAVALAVEWLAKPGLEARKERILGRYHARADVWRALDRILLAAAESVGAASIASTAIRFPNAACTRAAALASSMQVGHGADMKKTAVGRAVGKVIRCPLIAVARNAGACPPVAVRGPPRLRSRGFRASEADP